MFQSSSHPATPYDLLRLTSERSRPCPECHPSGCPCWCASLFDRQLQSLPNRCSTPTVGHSDGNPAGTGFRAIARTIKCLLWHDQHDACRFRLYRTFCRMTAADRSTRPFSQQSTVRRSQQAEQQPHWSMDHGPCSLRERRAGGD